MSSCSPSLLGNILPVAHPCQGPSCRAVSSRAVLSLPAPVEVEARDGSVQPSDAAVLDISAVGQGCHAAPWLSPRSESGWPLVNGLSTVENRKAKVDALAVSSRASCYVALSRKSMTFQHENAIQLRCVQ
jgi:hypothetical protein